MEIQEKIVNLREKQNMTQKELADKIGINKAVMNRIEQGERDLRSHELKAISDVFDVSSDYLLGKHDQENEGTSVYIGDDLTKEQKEEIYRYIEAIKTRNNNSKK